MNPKRAEAVRKKKIKPRESWAKKGGKAFEELLALKISKEVDSPEIIEDYYQKINNKIRQAIKGFINFLLKY